MLTKSISILLLVASAAPVFAQEASQAIDCSAPANAERAECLALPTEVGNQPITNFAPLIAPFLGVAAAGALLGGGGTTSTPSTTD